MLQTQHLLTGWEASGSLISQDDQDKYLIYLSSENFCLTALANDSGFEIALDEKNKRSITANAIDKKLCVLLIDAIIQHLRAKQIISSVKEKLHRGVKA